MKEKHSTHMCLLALSPASWLAVGVSEVVVVVIVEVTVVGGVVLLDVLSFAKLSRSLSCFAAYQRAQAINVQN